MPQISVIVPVYKVEPYLRRCVDSVLAQTFTDFELILVDDGSPDGCPAICDDYAAQDERVRVIHQENGGLSAARNAGIDWAFANSNSEWITFIDSDDWVHQEMLQQLYNAAIKNTVEVSICGYIETNADHVDWNWEWSSFNKCTPEEFYVQHIANANMACAKLYKKKLFREVRYPINLLHEDAFTTYKILFELPVICFTDSPLYWYFQNSSSITHSRLTMNRLVVYDAINQQIEFFRNRKFYCAEKARIRHTIIDYSKLSLKECDNIHTYACLYIRRCKFYCANLKCLTCHNDQDAWALTQAFPAAMWIYWHWQALKKKLAKFLKHK